MQRERFHKQRHIECELFCTTSCGYENSSCVDSGCMWQFAEAVLMHLCLCSACWLPYVKNSCHPLVVTWDHWSFPVCILAPTALSFDARLDDRGAPPDENQAIDDEDMNEDNADEVEMINPDPLPPSNDGTSDASGARWRATFDAAASTLITIFSASSCATSPTSTVTNTSTTADHQRAHRQQNKHITQQNIQQKEYHRYGTLPSTPARRWRSRTPISPRDGRARPEQQENFQVNNSLEFNNLLNYQHWSQLLRNYNLMINMPYYQTTSQCHNKKQGHKMLCHNSLQLQVRMKPLRLIHPMCQSLPWATARSTTRATASRSFTWSSFAVDGPFQPQLPQKRPFPSDDAGSDVHLGGKWGRHHLRTTFSSGWISLGWLWISTTTMSHALLGITSTPRCQQQGSHNSGTEDLTPKTRRSRSISRTSMELKASGREIPWRILGRPQSYQNRFLEAINKEAESWSSWQSVEPLSFMEADNCWSTECSRAGHASETSLEIRAKCCGGFWWLGSWLWLGPKEFGETRKIGRALMCTSWSFLATTPSSLTQGGSGTVWQKSSATSSTPLWRAEKPHQVAASPLLGETNIYSLAKAPHTWNKEVWLGFNPWTTSSAPSTSSVCTRLSMTK